MKIVIANSNPIISKEFDQLSFDYDIVFIEDKNNLTLKKLGEIDPDYIFFPHWSFIIPEVIYQKFECVVFHMTDLPFGRGGSPLQNLIARGFQKTKISALRVAKGLDTGDIYLKKELLLLGTAEEIFLRSASIISEMIGHIISENISPIKQVGEITTFKRRKPEDSNCKNIETTKSLFDFIRMLDAESYPNAFILSEHFKLEFTRASLKKDSIIADVRITKR